MTPFAGFRTRSPVSLAGAVIRAFWREKLPLIMVAIVGRQWQLEYRRWRRVTLFNDWTLSDNSARHWAGTIAELPTGGGNL